jgi:hypothetical protein
MDRSKYEINMELVVSTAHLKEATGRSIDDGQELGFTYDKTNYGCIVYVDLFTKPKEFVAETLPTFPEEMRPLVSLARSLGCKWLRFDCDADPIDGYSTYDW